MRKGIPRRYFYYKGTIHLVSPLLSPTGSIASNNSTKSGLSPCKIVKQPLAVHSPSYGYSLFTHSAYSSVSLCLHNTLSLIPGPARFKFRFERSLKKSIMSDLFLLLSFSQCGCPNSSTVSPVVFIKHSMPPCFCSSQDGVKGRIAKTN